MSRSLLYVLVAPTHVYGISGSLQAFFLHVPFWKKFVGVTMHWYLLMFCQYLSTSVNTVNLFIVPGWLGEVRVGKGGIQLRLAVLAPLLVDLGAQCGHDDIILLVFISQQSCSIEHVDRHSRSGSLWGRPLRMGHRHMRRCASAWMSLSDMPHAYKWYTYIYIIPTTQYMNI